MPATPINMRRNLRNGSRLRNGYSRRATNRAGVGYPIVSVPVVESNDVGSRSSDRDAGPRSRSPFAANSESWHGQWNWLFRTSVSHPSCVQMLDDATNVVVPVRTTPID